MREEDIKYIHELEKRVYELEETIEKQKHEIERYREYLELIRIIGTHGTNIESREVIMSDEASLADEALEG